MGSDGKPQEVAIVVLCLLLKTLTNVPIWSVSLNCSIFSLFVQWRDRGHLHCWPLSWPGYGTLSTGEHTLKDTVELNIFGTDLVSMTSFQGQIKTGAPCRSERLAKYNQVSVRTCARLLRFPTRLCLRLSSLNQTFAVAAAQDRGRARWCRSLRWSKVQGTSGALLNQECPESGERRRGCFLWSY